MAKLGEEMMRELLTVLNINLSPQIQENYSQRAGGVCRCDLRNSVSSSHGVFLERSCEGRRPEIGKCPDFLQVENGLSQIQGNAVLINNPWKSVREFHAKVLLKVCKEEYGNLLESVQIC